MKDLFEFYPPITILKDEPLSNYTYTKTGGKADYLIFPKNPTEVKVILDWVNDQSIPLTVIGNASNLIVKDGGIRGLVMILSEMNQIIQLDQQQIQAQSGALLADVAAFARDVTLSGLEFACGIPGSIGGAIFMNAGAYGGEMAAVVYQVDAITRQGEFVTYDLDACQFSYRHSLFQDQGDIILAVRYQLHEGGRDAIQAVMTELTQLRESKQPLEYPSCGSVFKRPPGHFTGKLIQEAGLQGYRIGGAEVSRKHAGFIVNVDQATATDYVDLIHYIQAVIWDQFQVRLEPEVRIIGEDQE